MVHITAQYHALHGTTDRSATTCIIEERNEICAELFSHPRPLTITSLDGRITPTRTLDLSSVPGHRRSNNGAGHADH